MAPSTSTRVSQPFSRRAVLRGAFGAVVSLPWLELHAGDGETTEPRPARFCGIYKSNGMAVAGWKKKSDWSWYPQGKGSDYVLGKSTAVFEPLRSDITFLGGLGHPNGAATDPHACADMWLTGAPLQDASRKIYNSVSMDQVIAAHTRSQCRLPSLVLSVDAGVGYQARTGTLSYNQHGQPIPAENNPRQIFERLFQSTGPQAVDQSRRRLAARKKIVDAIKNNARSLERHLGSTDRHKMDQFMTSLSEVETQVVAAERWADIPLKKQDYSDVDLDVVLKAGMDPSQFYRTIFDIISLAFDADITRSVTFMLDREDGKGISDHFPKILGFKGGHHNLSHGKFNSKRWLNFARYDGYISKHITYFIRRLAGFADGDRRLLDSTVVLFGSGCSSTHRPHNVPHLLAGGGSLGIKHGSYRHHGKKLSDLHLAIMRAMKLPVHRFADSQGSFPAGLFTTT